MATIEEKARKLREDLEYILQEHLPIYVEAKIADTLREHGRDVRHACAEAAIKTVVNVLDLDNAMGSEPRRLGEYVRAAIMHVEV